MQIHLLTLTSFSLKSIQFAYTKKYLFYSSWYNVLDTIYQRIDEIK